VKRSSGLIRLAEEHSKNKEPRDFPLVGAVAALIDKWEARHLPHCPFVFHCNGTSIEATSWRRAWRKAAIQAGLGHFDADGKYNGINLHDTRRAFVTDMINAGQDSQTVMALSGHRSRAIFDRYRILQTANLVRAIEGHEQYLDEHSAERVVVPLRRAANK
jgi:integrase